MNNNANDISNEYVVGVSVDDGKQVEVGQTATSDDSILFPQIEEGKSLTRLFKRDSTCDFCGNELSKEEFEQSCVGTLIQCEQCCEDDRTAMEDSFYNPNFIHYGFDCGIGGLP